MPTQFKTACIILLMVSLAFVSYAPPAHAIPVAEIASLQTVFSIGSWIKNTVTAIQTAITSKKEILNFTKEWMLDPAAWAISKSQIHSEANTILAQVRGGGNARGETGGPLFVTDWENVSRNAVSNQRKFFLQELATTKKVDPAFQETLLGAFSGNPDRSVFNRLQSTFGRDTGCAGSSCLQNFLGDFSQGGWAGWNSVTTNPGNNPYRSYLELQAEKNRREESARQARLNEALASGGSLGTQDCTNEPSTEGNSANNVFRCVSEPGSNVFNLVDPSGAVVNTFTDLNQCYAGAQSQNQTSNQAAPKLQKCKVTRPGSTVTNDLSKVLGEPSDTLQQTDEFSELIVGAFANLIGSLRSQGIKSDTAVGNDTIISNSQTAVKDTNKAQAEKTINDLKNSVNKSIGELSSIWEIKAKSLDLIDEIDPGVMYEINITQADVDSGGKCAVMPSVSEQLPIDLENARTEKNTLANEVGYPIDFSNPVNGEPPLGYYENGGLYSEKLFNQQAELEYLDQVISSNGDVKPSIAVSGELEASFRWNDTSFSSDERIQAAQQLIGAEVGKVSELLTQIGDPASAKAEQQGIQQKILAQRQNRRSCYLPQQ